MVKKLLMAGLLFGSLATIQANDMQRSMELAGMLAKGNAGVNEHSNRDTIIAAAIMGFTQSVGVAAAEPLKPVFHKLVAPFLHPVDSINSFRLTVFTVLIANSLNYDRLVHFQQSLNTVINNLIIDPANTSSKALRRALLADAGETENNDAVEFKFAVKVVLDHIDFFKNYLINSKTIYDATKAGILARMLNPYDSQRGSEISFFVNQVISHCEFLAQEIQKLDNLAAINDKKDAISMIVKNLTSEIAYLCFLIDSSRASDTKQAGLKMIFDQSKFSDKGAAVATY